MKKRTRGRPPALIEGPCLTEEGVLKPLAGQQGPDHAQSSAISSRGQAACVADGEDPSFAWPCTSCLERFHNSIRPMLAYALQVSVWSDNRPSFTNKSA